MRLLSLMLLLAAMVTPSWAFGEDDDGGSNFSVPSGGSSFLPPENNDTPPPDALGPMQGGSPADVNPFRGGASEPEHENRGAFHPYGGPVDNNDTAPAVPHEDDEEIDPMSKKGRKMKMKY